MKTSHWPIFIRIKNSLSVAGPLNEKAYSITSIMVGVALMGVIAIVAAQLVTSSKTAEISSSIQAEVDQGHALQLQMLANKKRLMKALGLITYNEVSPDISTWTEASYSNEYYCLSVNAKELKAHGISDCRTFETTPKTVTIGNSETKIGGANSKRSVKTELLFKMKCSVKEKCEGFELSLSTKPTLAANDIMATRGYQARVTQVNYSGALITNRAQINFSCAVDNGSTQHFGTSMDLKSLNVDCTALFDGVDQCQPNPSTDPMVITALAGPPGAAGIAAYCKPKVAKNCSSGSDLGLKVAGVFFADPVCNN